MAYPLTNEQHNILKLAADPSIHLLKIEAVAGSGKSHTLQEIAKQSGPDTTQLYLTFSSKMAKEAAKQFPHYTDCRTIHSLAYKYTVKPYNLKLGTFRAAFIKHPFATYVKRDAVKLMEEFFLSKYLTVPNFIAGTALDVSDSVRVLAETCIDDMAHGRISCTHGFYLKYFHILLHNGDIDIPKLDLLMIDEAGDLSNLTIDVFNLLPAKTKVMAGDSKQAIFDFMHCTNAFDVLHSTGTTATLSQSFRVNTTIADSVRHFMQHNVDPSFAFSGFQYPPDPTITTEMYITRSNSALLTRAISIMRSGLPFSLTRDIDTILSIPLTIIAVEMDVEYKSSTRAFITSIYKRWRSNGEATTFVKYLLEHPDSEIKSAAKTITMYGSNTLVQLQRYVHANPDPNYMLSTAHSCKGLTVDRVTIDQEVDQHIAELERKLDVAIGTAADKLRSTLQTEYLLAYVAFTRARHVVDGTQYV